VAQGTPMAGGPDRRGGGIRREGGGRPGAAGSATAAGADPGKGQPQIDQNGGGEETRRGVILQKGQEYEIRLVKTGVSSLDHTEVLAGLAENDQVVYTFYSRATEASTQMRERMTAMQSQRSGFRSN